MESETQPNSQPKSPEDGAPEGSQKKPRTRRLWEWLAVREKGEKTVLDLLQVIAALLIPVVVVVMASIFTACQTRIQQQAEDQRAKQQQSIEEQRAQSQLKADEQRAQDEALQAYFEEMGNLLLDEELRTSQEGDEASTLARART